MLSRRVARACYSTNITQDFINDLLVRAKEATTNSVKTATPKQQNGQKKGNYNRNRDGERQGKFARDGERSGKFARDGNRPPRNANGRRFNRDGQRNNQQQKSDTAQGQAMANADPNSTVKFEQRQFGGRKSADTDSADLLDVLEDAPKLNARSDNKQSFQKRRGPRVRRNASNQRGNDKFRAPRAPVVVESLDYHPEEITPASLLKYSSDLYHVQSSRANNFALRSMNESNFPVVRQCNIDSVHAYTPFLADGSFGKYMPAHSLILQKEAQLRNTEVVVNKEELLASVKGKYPQLKDHKAADFKGVSSNAATQKNLAKHSHIVRLALQNNTALNRNPEKLNIVYDVCSGLKPMSELRNAN